MAKAIPMTSSNVLKKQKRMRRIRDNVELYSLILPVLIHIFRTIRRARRSLRLTVR